jgi:hypothetical protein
LLDDSSATDLLASGSNQNWRSVCCLRCNIGTQVAHRTLTKFHACAASQKQQSIRTIYNKNEKTPGVAAGGFNTGVVG